ncbi:hypothetical protein H6P81_013338 [Aristolochia fimbriata]|uniref:Uncharacterized protein n=1 Tax=Aristolochia fimbriata TaxID=158543 RepID=A0AAV7EEF3_ARIFI|nr:hypothetical protein H6P81_013338 [Aristolochia fimbriata]
MVNHISITDDDQEEEEFVLKEAPTEFEEGGQSTVDELKKVDLGTTEDPRPTFLNASLTAEEEVEYMALLRKYRDIFAWNYTEMPGLDPQMAVHKLAVHPSVRPVKQSQRRFRPELVPEIKKEVDKLIAANFIREVKYPSWIANIVPVQKKTGLVDDSIAVERLIVFKGEASSELAFSTEPLLPLHRGDRFLGRSKSVYFIRKDEESYTPSNAMDLKCNSKRKIDSSNDDKNTSYRYGRTEPEEAGK